VDVVVGVAEGTGVNVGIGVEVMVGVSVGVFVLMGTSVGSEDGNGWAVGVNVTAAPLAQAVRVKMSNRLTKTRLKVLGVIF